MNWIPKRLSTRLIIPILMAIIIALGSVFVLLNQHLKESTVKLNTSFLMQETKSLSNFCDRAVGEMIATNIFGNLGKTKAIKELTLSTIESYLLSEGLDGFILKETDILFSTINLQVIPELGEAKGTLRLETADGIYHGYYLHFPAWRWYLITLIPERQYWETLNDAHRLMWSTGFIFCFLVIAAYFLLWINLLKPMAKILKELEKDEKISHQTGIEELDTLSNTINVSIASAAISNYLLAESETKLINILKHSTEFGFVTTDIDFNIDLFNPKAEDLFQCSADRAYGQSVIDLIPCSENSHRDHDQIKNQLFNQGKCEFEWQQKNYTGNNQWIYSILTPMVDDSGDHCGYILTTRDVTEKRQKEYEQEEVKKKLRRAEKMEVVGLMAGGVAHDLNNILSGVVSYPELLLMQLPEKSSLREPLMTIQEAGKRAADVVSDLLTIARAVAIEQNTENLNILIEEYLNSLEYNKLRSGHVNIIIEKNLASDLLNISCSSLHIMKCLMNLVTNAYEAIGDNGRIVISTFNQYVDKPISENHYMKKGEYAVLQVTDTGPGISKNDIRHIFEPFYTKKVMGRSGTGLGLAIVWNTVHDHQGGITIASDKNGTTFNLYFPASREKIGDEKQDFEYEDLYGNNELILVIDDEKQQRKICCKMLKALNYRSDSVASGEEAVEYLQNHPVDLLILDMLMDPGMNGLETYKHIIRSHPGQKALIVSGFSENSDVKRTQELGAGSFLKKPYMINELGITLKQELER